ncbi:N-acetylmuramoyl-L-alanine amidase [Pleurocapsa sp. PCC 7327]|uniref:hormogonium tapered terminus morphoprotein TftA n=1 Tax=Pleurocapsa sp. PCC 7327 TaxID=118163 RepID=UPI00029FC7F4|nr:glucosaminidase domain-containing protein [Pleurocapsa sp. PCC 7327]AFY77426.1 N-acetylmuramoyl-L-alanine amidase [Pleurocapsa sp. PCC 7327]
MGRIFLWTGHAKQPGIFCAQKVAATQQMVMLRDGIIAELRSRGAEVFVVPDDLSLSNSIQWINDRSLPTDIALAIENSSDCLQGTSIFYIANNAERKKHAELLSLLLIRSLPQLNSQGCQPDTVTKMGRLAFCRQANIPSLLIKIGSLSNSNSDFDRQITIGLADGLIAWSRDVANFVPNSSYPNIDIKLNHQTYEERGILVNGNAYIPIDLCDRLGVDFTQFDDVRLVWDRGVVYLKAIELRDRNFSVTWDNLSQTVILRSILSIDRDRIDCIMGQGNTSDVQMMIFLKANNENALDKFSDLPKIYREEGTIEGVNYDIAFCQMCLETDFLRFGESARFSENNFANLGLVDGGEHLATFPNPRLGVRAQIQHLKAYASLEPLVQEVVDPRFYLVRRGVASRVSQLSGRWSADLSYGDRIMAMLRRLYESTNLL